MSVTAGYRAVRRPGEAVRTAATGVVARSANAAVVAPLVLFAIALTARTWAVGMIKFPMTEGSAYYVDVARNLAGGRGFVIDSIWSYATPPLTLPRPAFELWQPLASILASIPMAIVGSTFDAARLGGVIVGALLAPLAWLVAREAADRLGVPPVRANWATLGAGALVAIGGPFVFTTAVPDSAMPFTVLAVAACVMVPRALRGARSGILGLGVLLGLAYLTRLEAVWVGAAFALLALRILPQRTIALSRVAAVAGLAAVVASPWWLRNLMTFGNPFPGQLSANAFLTRNEQIFAWADQPTLTGFLAQGAPTIVGNVGKALWHDAVNVLLIPAAPIVAIAVLVLCAAVVRLRHANGSPWDLAPTALGALLISGLITFAVTSVLFPVATLWGTFEHASGPLLVGLTVAAVLGADAFVAWLVRKRSWQRTNGWLAPLALVALTAPLTLFQVTSASRQATEEAAAIAAIGAAVPEYLDAAGVPGSAAVITDRPIWLADALGRPGLALPDEPVESVLAIARHFGARAVVVVEARGSYPAALDAATSAARQTAAGTRPAAGACFFPREDIGGVAVFVIAPECAQ